MADIITRAKTFSNTVTFNGAVTANAGLTVSGGSSAENNQAHNMSASQSSGFSGLQMNVAKCTSGNRNLITIYCAYNFNNSNGTGLTSQIQVRIMDGVSVMHTRVIAQAVPNASLRLSFCFTVILPLPAAANYTIDFADVENDGGSRSFSQFFYQSSTSALQLG